MTVTRPVSIAPYNLSFTAASLRPELARIVAEQFLVERDWERTKANILSGNALQCRSPSSAIRLEREIRQRLMKLTLAQLEVLAYAPAEDRTALAWLAVCKSSVFAFEFAAEVLRDKLATHDPVLRQSDYETYVENKAALHPELGELSASSKTKIQQVLLLMLKEAGVLQKKPALGSICRPVLSPHVIAVIKDDDPCWLAGFLMPERELNN